MPVYVMFQATHDVFTRGSAPTAAAIQGALERVQTTVNTAPAAARPLQLGNWVGAPRVTRVALLVSTGGRKTRAAWLYEFPDLSDDPALQSEVRRYESIRRERLRTQALENLRRYAGGAAWQNAILTDYNAGINGTVDWWRSGQAADTVTRDAFDLNQQLGSSTEENPVGPDTTHRPPALDPLSPLGGSPLVANALGALKWIVIGGVVLYVAGPALRDVLSASGRRYASRSAARANPKRRRR